MHHNALHGIKVAEQFLFEQGNFHVFSNWDKKVLTTCFIKY